MPRKTHTYKHIHLDTHHIYTTTLRAPCWPRAPHGPCWSDGSMAICARVVIWLAGGFQILLSKQASITSCSAVLQLLLFKNLRYSKSSYINITISMCTYIYIYIYYIYLYKLHVDVKLQLFGRCCWPLCDQTQGGHQKCPQNLEVAGAMDLLSFVSLGCIPGPQTVEFVKV